MREKGSSVSGVMDYELLKIIHHHFLARFLKDSFDKLNMHRMDLVIVLGFLVGKDQIQGDLVGLVYDRPMAGGHLSDMVMQYAGDRFQKFIRSGDQLVGRVRVAWIRPKYNNV